MIGASLQYRGSWILFTICFRLLSTLEIMTLFIIVVTYSFYDSILKEAITSNYLLGNLD